MIGGQLRNGVLHVGDTEGEVVHDSDVLERGVGWVVQHVLDPVGAVGNLEADPVDGVGFGPAIPVGTKAEDVDPEGVFFGAIADHEAGVDDAVRGGIGG